MVASIEDKPWHELTAEAIDALPAQLGVYEIANAAGVVTRIGFAGGTEPFGMRTALHRELEAGATQFRLEFTHGYMTRWHELLMRYEARYGELPVGNHDQVGKLGRLSPLE